MTTAGSRQRGATARRAALATAAAALLALAAFAPRAEAVIEQLGGGRTVSYLPLRTAGESFDSVFSNLDYNGGPVMASNTNYAIYWQPAGAPAYPPDYAPGIDRYLEDLAHDSGGHQNVDSVSTQYNDAAGHFASYESHFAAALVDSDPYPANGCAQAATCLTDGQLRSELAKFIAARGLPADLANEYFLLTPPGVENCLKASGSACSAGSAKPAYCAYHGDIPYGEGEIVYASDPYVTGIEGCDDGNHPNGSSSDGALEGGLTHEHNESITDPLPNGAWTDFGGSGGEIGDKCAGTMGPALGTAPDGASYNQLIDGDQYWYQEEWSNQTNQCLQRFTLSGSEPTATFIATPAVGTEVSLDASGSTAPGGVAEYNWQWDDGPGLTRPTEVSSPTVTHAFPAEGTYLVALTVFAHDGTSIGTVQAVVVGSAPQPAVTKVKPTKGPAAGGTAVTISGSAFTGASRVAFGSTPAASFKVNSSTAIVATTQPETVGVVDVSVTTPGGTSAPSIYDHFKFGPPTISSVSPAEGSRGGGANVLVNGTGFSPGSSGTLFKFGSLPAQAVACTSLTSCTMLAPAHSAGTVEVRATVAKLTSPKDPPADQFIYR